MKPSLRLAAVVLLTLFTAEPAAALACELACASPRPSANATAGDASASAGCPAHAVENRDGSTVSLSQPKDACGHDRSLEAAAAVPVTGASRLTVVNASAGILFHPPVKEPAIRETTPQTPPGSLSNRFRPLRV